MIVPALKDDALLGDIASVLETDDRFHLWWLGQSGFLLKWRGRTVLFDPYLSDSLTEKYAETDKPHVRMTQRCVAPERLGFVDIVTSSHAHTDHFDAATLGPIAGVHRSPLPLVLPAANTGLAQDRLGGTKFDLHGLDTGERLVLGEFEFIGIPAAHDTIELDEEGRCRYLGFVVRFGPWAVYHSGDTRWFDELPRLLAGYRLDVALVPINGHEPARRVAGNLNGTEAAALAKQAGALVAIPHHYDMFTFNTATPGDFIEACRDLQQPCHIARCGARWRSTSRPARQKSVRWR